jgi:Fur family ferric uptake transcriptional regulator
MDRMTTARQLILNELERAESHLTAMHIYDSLKDKLPSLNLSTVYRSLEYLVKNQLISVSDLGLGSPVYETIQPIHHHLVCLSCKKIFHLEDEIVSKFFEKLQKEKNFIILTNHLILYGHCRQCQKKITLMKGV